MGKLTVTFVRNIKEQGRYGDGEGLFLTVSESGAKSWIVRVQKAKRRRDIGVGSASKVTLAAARVEAALVRSQVQAGLDPVLERRKREGIPTFEQAAKLVFDEYKRTWKNKKHTWQWYRTLEMYVFPSFGDRSVAEVSAPMVNNVVAEIWQSKNVTARRILQRICAVLDFAYAKGWREAEAPMRSITKGLTRRTKRADHLAALPYRDVPQFLDRLRGAKVTHGRLALEALILTAARSGEIRGARWGELDLVRATWTIPAERMKAGKEHIVPLSNEAIDVFKRAANLKIGETELVFPGAKRGAPLSDMTLVKVVRDMDVDATPHGFRSSFRDWAAEQTDFPSEIAEAALAHFNRNKVEAAYRRTNYLEKRGALMAAWGAFCVQRAAAAIRLAS